MPINTSVDDSRIMFAPNHTRIERSQTKEKEPCCRRLQPLSRMSQRIYNGLICAVYYYPIILCEVQIWNKSRSIADGIQYTANHLHIRWRCESRGSAFRDPGTRRAARHAQA